MTLKSILVCVCSISALTLSFTHSQAQTTPSVSATQLTALMNEAKKRQIELDEKIINGEKIDLHERKLLDARIQDLEYIQDAGHQTAIREIHQTVVNQLKVAKAEIQNLLNERAQITKDASTSTTVEIQLQAVYDYFAWAQSTVNKTDDLYQQKKIIESIQKLNHFGPHPYSYSFYMNAAKFFDQRGTTLESSPDLNILSNDQFFYVDFTCKITPKIPEAYLGSMKQTKESIKNSIDPKNLMEYTYRDCNRLLNLNTDAEFEQEAWRLLGAQNVTLNSVPVEPQSRFLYFVGKVDQDLEEKLVLSQSIPKPKSIQSQAQTLTLSWSELYRYIENPESLSKNDKLVVKGLSESIRLSKKDDSVPKNVYVGHYHGKRFLMVLFEKQTSFYHFSYFDSETVVYNHSRDNYKVTFSTERKYWNTLETFNITHNERTAILEVTFGDSKSLGPIKLEAASINGELK